MTDLRLYLLIDPVTQGHYTGGFAGLDSSKLQRHDAAAELPEGGQALLVPPQWRFISLKVQTKHKQLLLLCVTADPQLLDYLTRKRQSWFYIETQQTPLEQHQLTAERKNSF